MADTEKPPEQLHSIVVVGAMNPRIHHPLWYRLSRFIDEESYNAAISPVGRRPVVVTPDLATFSTPSFTIVCHPNRWEIHTPSESEREGILDVAAKVFEKLNETTVDRYGFNTAIHRATNIANASERLGEMLRSLNLGFGGKGRARPAVTYQSGDDPLVSTTQIAGSILGPEYVEVTYNTNHKVLAGEGKTDELHFDLGLLMRQFFEDDYRAALNIVDQVVERISQEK